MLWANNSFWTQMKLPDTPRFLNILEHGEDAFFPSSSSSSSSPSGSAIPSHYYCFLSLSYGNFHCLEWLMGREGKHSTSPNNLPPLPQNYFHMQENCRHISSCITFEGTHLVPWIMNYLWSALTVVVKALAENSCFSSGGFTYRKWSIFCLPLYIIWLCESETKTECGYNIWWRNIQDIILSWRVSEE